MSQIFLSECAPHQISPEPSRHLALVFQPDRHVSLQPIHHSTALHILRPSLFGSRCCCSSAVDRTRIYPSSSAWCHYHNWCRIARTQAAWSSSSAQYCSQCPWSHQWSRQRKWCCGSCTSIGFQLDSLKSLFHLEIETYTPLCSLRVSDWLFLEEPSRRLFYRLFESDHGLGFVEAFDSENDLKERISACFHHRKVDLVVRPFPVGRTRFSNMRSSWACSSCDSSALARICLSTSIHGSRWKLWSFWFWLHQVKSMWFWKWGRFHHLMNWGDLNLLLLPFHYKSQDYHLERRRIWAFQSARIMYLKFARAIIMLELLCRDFESVG